MALINCPECGASVSDRATQCPNCAYPIGQAAPARAPQPQQPYQPQQQAYQQPAYQQPQTPNQAPPDSNMVWAILTTLFCCLPFGIAAIVQASKVNSLWLAGRQQEAIEASKKASDYATWAAVIGVLGGIIYAVVMAMAANSAY